MGFSCRSKASKTCRSDKPDVDLFEVLKKFLQTNTPCGGAGKMGWGSNGGDRLFHFLNFAGFYTRYAFSVEEVLYFVDHVYCMSTQYLCRVLPN